ncbi:MAG: hypothetical protein ACLTMP_14720 [Eggerthella lenta]
MAILQALVASPGPGRRRATTTSGRRRAVLRRPGVGSQPFDLHPPFRAGRAAQDPAAFDDRHPAKWVVTGKVALLRRRSRAPRPPGLFLLR